MLEKVNTSVIFYAQYIASKVGATGLTVTVDVWEVTRAGAATEIVTGGSATEIGDGLYRYLLAAGSVDAAAEYIAVFKTADTSVDQQHLSAVWAIQRAGIENLDAAVSSRSDLAVTDILSDATPFPGANIDAAISTRGTAQPGDAMALTSGERTTLAGVIWNTLTSALTTVGSIGKLIVDYLDAAVSSIASTVAASGSSVATGDLVDMVKWVTYAATVSSLTIPATWAKVYFTCKDNAEKEADVEAMLQVVVTNGGAETDGLLRVEGNAPTAYTGVTAASGSLTVDQSAGTVAIALSDTLMGNLATRGGIGWDLKCERADGTTVMLAYGDVRTRATETRAL